MEALNTKEAHADTQTIFKIARQKVAEFREMHRETRLKRSFMEKLYLVCSALGFFGMLQLLQHYKTYIKIKKKQHNSLEMGNRELHFIYVFFHTL